MRLLGVTGGVGMGKSACASLLRAQGVAVVDTDDLARQAVEPGQPALTEIIRAFGADLIAADGTLLRSKLAQIVFGDTTARRTLEQILHPRIRAEWRRQTAEIASTGAALAAVIIPLLFETGAEQELDATVCVACTCATQRRRLSARGWSPEQSEGRITTQLPVDLKMARSTYVIWSEGSLELHAAQLRRVLRSLLGN